MAQTAMAERNTPTATTKKDMPVMKGKEPKETESKRFVKQSKIMKRERLEFMKTPESNVATVMYETRLTSKVLALTDYATRKRARNARCGTLVPHS